MKRVLVVGAGVGGSMVAREARARGAEVTVAADSARPAASHAALCVVCPAWFSGELRQCANEAVRVYRAIGAVTADDAAYSRWDFKAAPKRRKGFHAVDPAAVLVPPDAELTWVPGDRPPGYDLVVLCLGADGPSRGVRSYGVTTVVEAGAKPGLTAYLAAPRKLMFAACHDGVTTRFGSSVASTAAAAWQLQYRAEAQARGMLPDTGEVTHVAGVRLMPEGAPGAIRRGDEAWTLDGFGRVGFSVAPSRAAQLLARAL